MLFNGPDNPQKLPLAVGDVDPMTPSNIWWFWPTRVRHSNNGYFRTLYSVSWLLL